MTLRLAQPPEAIAEAARLRLSIRPAKVAAILDIDRSEVYKLVRARKLEGHGLGKRGLRIYADSVDAYRAARPLGARAEPVEADPLDAGHHEAVAHLKAMGVL